MMMRKIMAAMLVMLLLFGITACKKDETEEPGGGENPGVEEPAPDQEAEELFYVLYLKHQSFPYIFADTYLIAADDPRLEGKLLEQFVVEELIKQEGVGELINPIPANTKVLSVTKEGQNVMVDLSKDFVDGMKGTQEDALVTVAVIVNALTTLPNNQSVQILVEGSPVESLLGADISQPFEFMTDYYADK